MNAVEFVVVVLCLAFGYWLVSRIMDRTPSSRSVAPDQRIVGPGAAADGGPVRLVHDNAEPVSASNWFRILNVDEAAAPAQIEAAYRAMINGGLDAAASMRVQQAYELGMKRVH